MHWRRFAVSSIPISDPAEFELWIRQRWMEKDELLEYYMQNGAFPEDENAASAEPIEGGLGSDLKQRIKVGGKERIITTTGGSSATGTWGGPIETKVKLKAWWEVLDIFVAILWVFLFSSFIIYENLTLSSETNFDFWY